MFDGQFTTFSILPLKINDTDRDDKEPAVFPTAAIAEEGKEEIHFEDP